MTAFSTLEAAATHCLLVLAQRDGHGATMVEMKGMEASVMAPIISSHTPGHPLEICICQSSLYNGTEQTRTAGANDSTSPTSTDANFKIGSNYNGGGNFINGYIGEIIVIESDSNNDRYDVEGYLAHKWGMAASLPSNHTHKTVSLIRGPKVTTDANSSSSAGTYAINLSDAMSAKYTFTYACGWKLGYFQSHRAVHRLGTELLGSGCGPNS